jgi:Domain of unknown function (DUF4333)
VPSIGVTTVLVMVLGGLALGGCGDSGSDGKAKAPIILDTKRVERAIEDSILTKRNIKADVDCPSGVHQGRGLTFDCVATTRAGKTTFVVHQQDDKGNVVYAAP